MLFYDCLGLLLVEQEVSGIRNAIKRYSLSRFDDIVVSSGIGSVGFSWKRLPNEYRLYFHVDGIKVAYLTATFPEQRLSLSQITIYGGSSASFSTWMSGSVPGFEISMTISDGTKLIFQCTSTGALYATKKDGKQNLVWKIQPQLSLSRAPRRERKAKDVYFNESEAGYPMMSIETESDQFIITFGEALEWWRRSDGAYRRHPL